MGARTHLLTLVAVLHLLQHTTLSALQYGFVGILYCHSCVGAGRDPWSPGSLPEHLVPCYSDPSLLSREARIPQTIANLVDLVQRLERDPGFVVDLRVMLTTILHKFRVDGLERNPSVPASPGVTPFRLTGLQHARHSVLMGRMLSGNPNLFPNASLSVQQQCALHLMLSAAVDPWERGDEHWICPRMPTPRSNLPGQPGLPGAGWQRQPGNRVYPDTVRDVGHWGGVNVSPPPPMEVASSAWSACPVEEGVVETGRGGGDGGVSAGAVLAGLAAGLQPQAVPLSALLSPRHLQRLRADGGSDTATVDNLWAATLAGDLAEVAAYQGPFAGGVLVLGPAGLWNDSSLPRIRFLSRQRPGSPDLAPVQHWDMTDAEIRGGFDGLALGSRIARWTESTGRLRLSQILDMYYSAKGIAFEPEVKACRRGLAVSESSASSRASSAFTPDTLFAQTSRFARTLTDSSPDAPYMTEAVLQNFTASSVRLFLRYAADLLNADACDTAPLTNVRVNALVILDTTWERKPAFEFITLLASGIEVGLFGSRLAVMNGGVQAADQGPMGGHWIVNFTDSPVQLAADWMAADQADDIWPTYLDLPWSLMAVISHLQSRAEAESSRGGVGGVHGEAVVILAASSTVSDADMRHAKVLVPRLKELSPDTRILYVVSEIGQERFQELASLDRDWDDAVLVVADTTPATVAHTVTNYLREMTGRLTAPECMLVQRGVTPATPALWPVQHAAHVWSSRGVRGSGGMVSRGEVEDYVSPGQLRLYRIHTAYLKPYVPVTVQLFGQDYGDLRMCLWRGAAPGGPLAAMRAAMRAEDGGGLDPPRDDTPQAECVNVAGSGAANVTIQDPCQERCAPLYVSVAASKSLFKCTEDDCRYPDQVRFLLQPRGLLCLGAEQSPSQSAASSTCSATWTASLMALLLLSSNS